MKKMVKKDPVSQAEKTAQDLKKFNKPWLNKNIDNSRKENVIRRVFGKTPVVISAPHAVKHSREGQVKPCDLYTGSLSYLLAKSLGGTLVASAKFEEGQDGNYTPLEQCAYKQELLKTVQEQKIKLVLDIHGIRDDRGFDICLGTAPTDEIPLQEKDRKVFETLAQVFGDQAVTLNPPGYSGTGDEKDTVTETVRVQTHQEVEAYQIELARHLRVPGEHSRDLLEDLSFFIKNTLKTS